MRRPARRLIGPLAIGSIAFLSACDSDRSPAKPTGLLGVRLGDNADAAAEQLGIACGWKKEALDGGQFEECSSQTRDAAGIELVGDDVEAFGLRGWARLHREGNRLVAVQWWSRACTQAEYAAFRSAVVTRFGLRPGPLDPGDSVGMGWGTGAAIHAEFRRQKSCAVSVANDEFGKPFGNAGTIRLVREIAGGLQPH